LRKVSAIALLVVSLSLPALARDREDRDTRRERERTPIQRIVAALKRFSVGALSWDLTGPKP
jgi:hypothetical protein